MALNPRDLNKYRADARAGHKLMTPEERLKLFQPYLPPPPPRSRSSSPRVDEITNARSSSSSSSASASRTRQDRKTRLGVRRFLLRQYHQLVFVIIHIFFSVYIRLRQAYHAVANRFYSVYYYHHRTPELIRRDVKGLRKLPKHLSVILTLDDQGRRSAGLERLMNEVADVAAWCASAGIPELSVYEKTGFLKEFLPETHLAISQQLRSYFGRDRPSLSVRAPHMPAIESARSSSHLHGSAGGGGIGSSSSSGDEDDSSGFHLSVLLISAEDGRDSMVDLTKTLAEMSQRKKLKPDDISMELVDAELTESIMSEPDLLILFGPHVELSSYPPWQIRLTEIFHVPDNQGVEYQVFYRGLRKYAQAQMRKGR
ncbi:hypothetical protein VTJ83DRAFT_2137 [Remersonia thermophila]|uniref:ditrans,polycis-polyprenyl diphosphate synthase [(2E,6E)-farnesyldiphosphate specific] n=1 Tax=Remersonia thermophila TaxID=72144 RepID=A0ABR4DHV7_9PEZI